MDVKKKTVTKTGKRFKDKKVKEWIVAYIFIAPLVIGLCIFYFFPFIQNFWFSFNDVNKFNRTSFIGLDNYINLLHNKELYRTLGNTLKYIVVTVPVGLFLSLMVAALLNADIKGKSFYRTIYFLPSVTMSVAIALVWKWIYNGEYGLLNSMLRELGLNGQNWLSNNRIALYMIMVVGIWGSIGYNMIILLAGMQGISKQYYEAAAIDGAGKVKQFFKITLPLLTPTIFFVLITSVISGFQVFDTIYMMVSKTSLAYESTQTIVMMFYRYAFDYGQKGFAAAISIILFVLILIVTIIQMITQKKWVNYD